jgi:hypothetical protein
VKMIDVGALSERRPENVPRSRRHSRQTIGRPRDAPDRYTRGIPIAVMRSDDGYIVSRTGKAPAFPLQDAGIERGMHRRDMENF